MSPDYKHYETVIDLSPQIGAHDPGLLIIHTTKKSKKKGFSARIKRPDSPGYITKSLKTSDEKIATSRAMAMYEDVRVDAAMGVKLAAGSFDDAFEQFVEAVASTKTEKRITQIKGHHARYYSPYFGSKKIARITSDDVQNWIDWRIDYWKTGPGKDRIAKNEKRLKNGAKVNRRTGKRITGLGNVAKTPSPKTIQMETGVLMEIFNWAYREKLIARPIQIDLKYKLDAISRKSKYAGRAGSRRGCWDAKGYNKLIKYLKRWSEGNGGIPSVYEDKPVDERHMYQRRLLFDAFKFNVHVGLRSGELKNAKWGHIRKHKDGYFYLIVNPNEEGRFGKTGQRDAILGGDARSQALDVLERRKKDSKFTGKDDFIFGAEDGSLVNDWNKTFVTILDRLDLRHDDQNNKMTFYSSRHLFLSFRIKWGRKDGTLDWDALSRQMGSGVSQLKSFYSHNEVHEAADSIIGSPFKSKPT